MNKRIYKLNMKISEAEKIELNRLIQEQQKSISDIVRIAIRNTFDVQEFLPSYKSSVFSFSTKRRSIFD